ncbi:hypothetical protein [Flavobacterium sp. NRK1]|uniref:hypothetical protein n=1 Tax=Flavobacterium sp. NRK1 TaxID=2954929 RepID=UPI002092EF26|nr:hypothetical protein [Flavobacterium sp. NRK1]MCO6146847.1 hypothetical protein [Flavobacterium sp. NRK1]
MKQLLTLLLLVFGTAAFANTDEPVSPPSAEGHETTVTSCHKTAAKTVKTQETATSSSVKDANIEKEKPRRAGTTKTCTTVERTSLGISGLFVNFVHKTNVKLVNLLLE